MIAETPPRAGRRRAVILVGNLANPYSRAIRLGRTLTARGYDVEIATPLAEGVAELERDGPLVIRRYEPTGPLARLSATFVAKPAPQPRPGERPSIPRRILRRLRRAPIMFLRTHRKRSIKWLLWPQTVRAWWHTLEHELEPADLYHACGVLAIAPALAARRRDRRAGRRSRVIHDIIDHQLDSNNVLDMPRLVRRFLVRREARWSRSADAHVSVNEPFAERAATLWSLPAVPVVVANYPEPWTPSPGTEVDRIRPILGLGPETRICLFWGRLGPFVGLDEMAEAVLLVPNTVLVILGFGRGWDSSVARDADPRFAGRHFTLPAVHPDELLPWVASADVALVTLPPVSYNQRYTTPNKFLEALAAGTPIVLGPDLPTMAGILQREDAGRIVASMAPQDIAAAIAAIVAVPEVDRRAWRERLVATARERYSWPVAARAYEGVLDRVEGMDAAG